MDHSWGQKGFENFEQSQKTEVPLVYNALNHFHLRKYSSLTFQTFAM